MLRCVLFASAALMVAIPMSATAQSTSQVVPSTRADQSPPGARSPQRTGPKTRPRASAPAFAPFTLRGVTVKGSSLPPSQISASYAPFIGQTMTPDRIQALSDAIAANYADANIALYTVIIPQQNLSSGVLKVNVLEGRVTGLDINTSKAGKAGALVQAYAEPLRDETLLSKSTLQRKVSLIRDIPGLDTPMQLLNGATDDGVVLKLDPTLRPVQFGLAVNNRGTAFLGKTQVQGDVYLNSFLRGGDQTRLTLAVPTEDDLFRFAALAHSTPIGTDGDTLLLNGSYLRTQPATTALVGHAYSLGAQYSRPVIRSYTQDLYVTLGVDGLNADNALFGARFSDDRTRAARLAVAYSHSYPNSVYYVVGSVSQGFDGLGARTLSPAFTDLKFTKFNLRGGYNVGIGQRGALRLKAAGQYSDDALPGSEQFSLGGPDYGRAFESSIIAGDKGYGASAEAAYRPGGLPRQVDGSELYVFVDGGKVEYLQRSIFAGANYSLSSAGGGVRITVLRSIVELEAAKELSSNTGFSTSNGWRGVFSIRTLF